VIKSRPEGGTVVRVVLPTSPEAAHKPAALLTPTAGEHTAHRAVA
jgi:hypothetical protein